MAPILDPTRAIGWRESPLQGLNCYLRYIEAVLRERGLSDSQIVALLASPVDLLRFDSRSAQWGGVAIAWQLGADLKSYHLSRDDSAEASMVYEPVLLLPNRKHLRDDEFFGVIDIADHALLAVEWTSDSIRCLDTDAADRGYERTLTWDEVDRSLNDGGLWALLEISEEPVPPGQLLAATSQMLPRSRHAIESFARRWSEGALHPAAASGLHFIVLGDFQPLLFLLSLRLKGESEIDSRIPRSLLRCSKAAAAVGFQILALHRFGKAADYTPALPVWRTFAGELRSLEDLICRPGSNQRESLSEYDFGLDRRIHTLTEEFFRGLLDLWETRHDDEHWVLGGARRSQV